VTYRVSLVLLLLWLLAPSTAPAQSPPAGVTLSGKVQDAGTRAALPYLALQLLSEKDGAFVGGRLTNEAGEFTFTALTKGAYVLVARAIGYRPVRRRVLVGELSAFLDLGTVPMTREAPTLGEVVVTADAGGRSAAMEKQTFTVADNVAQAGGSVMQAMSTLPGVSVGQDGKVQVRGSDKVVVLIDGKQTALTGFGSQSGLDNLPASALERIEIINNPSARFDANASAGIINLVFKKQEQRGLNGRVGLTGGAGALWVKRENLPTIRPQFQRTPKLNPSLSLNYRKGATNSFLQGDWLHSPTLNKNEFSTRTYDDGTVVLQQVKRNRRTDYATLNAGADHALGARNTLSISGLFNREKIIDDGDNPYFDGVAAEPLPPVAVPRGRGQVHRVRHGAFRHRFGRPGHTLAFTANYSFHREDEQYFLHQHAAGVGRHATRSSCSPTSTSWTWARTTSGRCARGASRPGSRGATARSPSTCSSSRAGTPPSTPAPAAGRRTARRSRRLRHYVFESERVELEGGVRLEGVQVDYDVNPTTTRTERRLPLLPAVPERACGVQVRRVQQALAVLQPARGPSERGRHPHLPKYDEPELIKVGNPALQPQYSTSAELGFRTGWSRGASTPRRITGSSTAPSRASPPRCRAACCCTTSSRTAGVAGAPARRSSGSRPSRVACRSAPTRTRTAGPSTRSPSSTCTPRPPATRRRANG
jgi:hypothetical protein